MQSCSNEADLRLRHGGSLLLEGARELRNELHAKRDGTQPVGKHLEKLGLIEFSSGAKIRLESPEHFVGQVQLFESNRARDAECRAAGERLFPVDDALR
jgi:hypothetical protein